MRHNFTINEKSFRIRPVEADDYTFIWQLRTNPVLNRYLHPIDPNPEKQRQWITDYFHLRNDFYFIVEDWRRKSNEGTIGIYNVDQTTRIGEWGRWLLRPNSMAALESVLLIYTFAFEVLGLQEVYCRTAEKNKHVVSFHDSCGLSQRLLLHNHFRLRDTVLDAVEHRLSVNEWTSVKEKLHALTSKIARRRESAT